MKHLFRALFLLLTLQASGLQAADDDAAALQATLADVNATLRQMRTRMAEVSALFALPFPDLPSEDQQGAIAARMTSDDVSMHELLNFYRYASTRVSLGSATQWLPTQIAIVRKAHQIFSAEIERRAVKSDSMSAVAEFGGEHHRAFLPRVVDMLSQALLDGGVEPSLYIKAMKHLASAHPSDADRIHKACVETMCRVPSPLIFNFSKALKLRGFDVTAPERLFTAVTLTLNIGFILIALFDCPTAVWRELTTRDATCFTEETICFEDDKMEMVLQAIVFFSLILLHELIGSPATS